MRGISKLIVLLVILQWSCDTTRSVEPLFKQHFIKYYGEAGDQEGKDFVINQDGTIVILGNTFQSGSVRKMYLVKADAEGNVMWERRLGNNDEIGQDIEPVTAGPEAGNYIILSNIRKNADDSLAIRLTVISQAGDSLKSVYFNDLKSQQGNAITPLSDGSFYLTGKTTDTDVSDAGNTDLPIPDVEDVLVVRINSDLTWTQSGISRIGSSSVGSGIKILEGPGKFYYAGYADMLVGGEPGIPGDYENNFVFGVFSDNPSAIANSFAGDNILNENLVAIAPSPAGIYMSVGTQVVSSTQGNLYAAIQPGSFGAPTSRGIIVAGGSFEAVGVSASGASKFLVLANKSEPGGRNIWLGRIPISLTPEFEVTFGAPNNDDTGSAVAELPNGDILVLATMNLTNQNKIALIKLKSNGTF